MIPERGGRRRALALCTGCLRTSSGPEGSSDKEHGSGAAGTPEPFAGRRPHSRRCPPTMTYQVLARTSRPQDFSSLVGQEPIVQALRNALAEGRVAQAYLFSG